MREEHAGTLTKIFVVILLFVDIIALQYEHDEAT